MKKRMVIFQQGGDSSSLDAGAVSSSLALAKNVAAQKQERPSTEPGEIQERRLSNHEIARRRLQRYLEERAERRARGA